MMTQPVATREWIWRQWALAVPGDWEMLQFSKTADQGRCAFADRYQFRVELDWRMVTSAPDFGRMLKDYEGVLAREHGFTHLRRGMQGPWQGIAGRQDGRDVSRWGRYFDPPSCLVELVFLGSPRRDTALESAVLNSFRWMPGEAGWQPWRAFGMGLVVPADLPLTECVVEPARAVMTFVGERRPVRWIFRRLGLADRWLDVPLATWLDRQAPRRVKQRVGTELKAPGHDIRILAGRYMPRGLLNPGGRYDAAAWVCPEDGRVYHVSRITRPARGVSAPMPAIQAMLSCCQRG